MELFGIYVTEDSDPWARRQLRDHLDAWSIGRDRKGAELAIHVWAAENPYLVVASTCRGPIRQAAQFMAKASDIPVNRSVTSWDRELIEVGIPDTPTTPRLLESLAWGLFLWTASRHPNHSQWEILQKGRQPDPLKTRHPKPLPPRAVLSHGLQSLPQPHHLGRPAVAILHPVPNSPRRRG